MSDSVIQVDHLWKKYRLGVLGTGTLRHDFNRWLHRVAGKPDPYAKVGEIQKAESRKQKPKAAGAISEDTNQFQLSTFPISALRDDEMWALRDISFEVKQGEILGIIGRNGAGKSTLLKVLSRVTAPTSGEVRVKGRIASLLEVGTGFHPELTGRENIFLNGAILGMTKAEIKGKLDEIVAFAEIEKFLDTPVKRYSSGMYVRLAFAVAAHLEPEILIVDEVLAVGDAEFQRKCLGKMGEVARGGRTVLFVSHNMAAVEALCSRALMLAFGSVVQEGRTQLITSDYLGRMTAGARVPAAERMDREGNGAIRFTDIRISVEGAKESKPVQSGDTVLFSLYYTRREALARPVFFLSIYDPFGVMLVHLNTHAAGGLNGSLGESGVVICRVPDMPLPPGCYRLNVAAMENGTMLDRLEAACQLPVEAGDFFGTGTLGGAEGAKLLVKHAWGARANLPGLRRLP